MVEFIVINCWGGEVSCGNLPGANSARRKINQKFIFFFIVKRRKKSFNIYLKKNLLCDVSKYTDKKLIFLAKLFFIRTK